MDLTELTIKQIHQGLVNKSFSCVDLTKAYLKNIKEKDKEINAYLTVTEDLALEQAKKVDDKIKQGQEIGPLEGVPCAIKDAIMVEGQKCTAASKILENYVAPYDATVIKKLKEQGVVILGKTNTDEFTMGASTENSAFGVTKNPYDKTKVSGGSSGGSAAAVAANMACFALGTDTGGSIRLPASFCGITGLNPTYGSVSRYGVIAHASSFDQVGPMTKNVEDAKIVLETICGKDKMDATSADYKYEEVKTDLKGLKIGLPKEYFAEGLDKEVEQIARSTIKKAEEAGAKIVEVELPNSKYAIACYYILVPSEASANLARYDGIKYGLSENGESLLDVYIKSREKGFGPEVKRRIMVGTYCLSSGYYDAYYKKAQEVRQLIRQDFAKVFEKVDLIFCPVAPFPAFGIGEKADDPLAMYLVDLYTGAVKLAQLPALSLPAGKIGKLPVGLQIIGNHFKENVIISVASQLEKMI